METPPISGPATEPLELWREVLDAMSRQDALGYLRRRCPTARPAVKVFQQLSTEQSNLRSHLADLGLEALSARTIAEDMEAFFVTVQTQACRWSRTEGDQVVVSPWHRDADGPPLASPPQRSLAILQDISRAILGELDLRRLLPLLVDRAATLAQADVSFLAMWDPASRVLDVVESHGLSGLKHHRLVLSDEEYAVLLDGDEARFVSARRVAWLRELLGPLGLSSALVAPLRYQQALLGVLGCAGLRTERGSEVFLELLSLLANQTAIAIRNAAHYREVVQKAAALHAANDQLRGLDRMKDEFLATVSHELRTPLNFITGFGSILLDEQEGELSEEQAYFVKNMMDGAFQLLGLVNDLLDYSRIRSGKLPLSLGPVALDTLLPEAHEKFRFHASEHDIRLTLEVPAGLPEVRGDRQRLLQVLNNLLANALKFTPDGGQVALTATPTAEGVRVEVSDTGVGIQPEQQSLLFNRFSQLEGGLTRPGGAGLGLAISKSLIEAQGGRIGVQSPATLSPGKGSAFWFTIPLAELS